MNCHILYGRNKLLASIIADCYFSVIIEDYFSIFRCGKNSRIDVCRFMNMLHPKDSDFRAMSSAIFKVGGIFVWRSEESCLYLLISRMESGTLLSDLIKS